MTISLSDLPKVRGRYREDVSLAETTWFRVGGAADLVFKPADAEDLAHFIRHKPQEIPVTILGAASNVIVRDGGIDGVVIRLGRGFAELSMETDNILVAGAANLDANVAEYACQQGAGGLAFLSGIPGAIGGALAMNAGAYGTEIKDVLIKAEAVSPEGEIVQLSVDELGYRYRHCDVPDGWIFTKAWFRTAPESSVEIVRQMQQIAQSRADSQPVRARTGGSTFRNPTEKTAKKAWELIDAAGCRGMMEGDAQVSIKHCNFLINQGGASAANLEQLGEKVRQKVQDHSGVKLMWEIKRIGKA